ncbi:hypothetical protein [Mucilaginibacter glaciei]|uniref:Fibronectin type-III domain-containing protein n=1 Tax=Mucilaginibacter glaciei TaxID=2772109 RepID=A0A926NL89_9SPHI|nr:hypothetical protein [Mucilaginibacter glaciei]MBD1394154.1 hypothetical protein [Mucilaginibacter glaciei]
MKRIYIIALVFIFAACGKGGNNSAPAPGKATLVAPLKDLTCNTGVILSATESSVAFSWNPAENTESYDLTIKNLLTQKDIVQNTPTPNATVTLLRNTPYSWSVTAKSSKSDTKTDSEVWKFYNAGAGITTYAPFPAELLTPTFGQVLPSGTTKINLTWKGSAVDNNITGYIVYFGPNSNPDVFRQRVTDSFVNDVTVSANTTYYWRIVTVDANNNISDSGTGNFFVK